MPTTVNGVGTHYYGKSNHSSRQGQCHSCNRVAKLDSYDTRLWFVVIFIPIIPLGRKRITDQCSSCRRHLVMPLDQWQKALKQTTTATLTEFATHPTAENARQHHLGLLQFHQHQEADAFRIEALKHFTTDAPLHVYFAQVQWQSGRVVEAGKLFERALELDRELPAAREGMALLHIQSGNLDAATELTKHLRAPGAGETHGLSLLENLALAWQKKGRHAEALEEFGVLLRELPSLGEHRGFRKMVSVSEKALKKPSTGSLLPKMNFSLARFWQERRTAVLVSLLVTMGIIGLVLNNQHLADNVPLHVVNAYPSALRVSIDGGPVQIANLGHTQLSIPEGKHTVTVHGAVTETIPVTIQRGFFERWGDNDAWVLNPGGRAIILEQTIYYSAGGFQPPENLPIFLTGHRLLRRPGIDFAFEEPPKEQQLTERQTHVTRTALRVRPGGVVDVVETLTSNGLASAALQFCEQGILDGTANDDLLAAYADLATDEKTRSRILRTLQSQIKKRPVRVALHRHRQTLESANGRADSEILAEYEAMAKAAPEDAALLYLRARIEPDFARQSAMLEKCTTMPNPPAWAWYGRGMDHALAGDWKTALPLLEKATTLEPNNSQFREKVQDAQRSLGMWEPLLKDLQAEARLQPQHFGAHLALVEAHAMKDDEKTARAFANNYMIGIKSMPDSGETVQEFNLLTAELLGQPDPVLELAASTASPAVTPELVSAALVMARRWSDLDALITKETKDPGVGDDPLFLLAAALAAKMDQQQAHATAWEARAIEYFSVMDDETDSITAALKSSTPPVPATLNLSHIQPHRRAVIWAWLAQKHPSQRSVYATLARAFNYRGYFPHRVVHAATAD